MALTEIRTPEDLADWMRRMNLSLTAAAEQLGRKRATIARYVNGITALPESVAHHAAVIEAAREGQPFFVARRTADFRLNVKSIGTGKLPGNMAGNLPGKLQIYSRDRRLEGCARSLWCPRD